MREVLKLEGVTASYDTIPIIEDVNLTVNETDFLGIIGPNGGGKTTLFRVILGLLAPREGTVRILGKSVAEGRRHVGYVPQYTNFELDYPATVLDVVLMGRAGRRGLFRRYSKEDYAKAREALRLVDMDGQEKKQIGKLSGGERQRILIARALSSDPKILLLDEPTASVDKRAEPGIYDLLSNLSRHMAIIMVSHDVGAISAYVNKIACLNRHLHYHGDREIHVEDIEEAYACPIELLVHGHRPHAVPHRELMEHDDVEDKEAEQQAKGNRDAATHDRLKQSKGEREDESKEGI